MAPRRRPGASSSRNWAVPLAVTLTAAAATAALWWWMDDEKPRNKKRDTTDPYSSDYDGGDPRRRRRPLSGVREETEPESERLDGSGRFIGGSGSGRPGMGTPRMSGGLVQEEEEGEYKYVPPVRKRGVAVVCSEKDPGGRLGEEEMIALRKSSFLSSLPPKPYNPTNTNLFFVLRQTTPTPFDKPIEKLAHTLAPESPDEFFINYTAHPEALVNILRTLEPETVYVEQGLAGEHGELCTALLQGGWVGKVIVVLEGGAEGLEGLLDSEDERALVEKKSGRWWEDGKGGVLDRFRGRCAVVERAYLAEDWNRRVVERS